MAKRKPAESEEPVPDQPAETTPPPADTGAEPQGERLAKQANPVRVWSERYSGPVRYQVLTDTRLKKIFFKFKLPEGEKTPSEQVLTIMRGHKANTEGQSTGLRFEDSRLHGKVWSLPNDTEGRALAAVIEADLEKIATKDTPGQEPDR